LVLVLVRTWYHSRHSTSTTPGTHLTICNPAGVRLIPIVEITVLGVNCVRDTPGVEGSSTKCVPDKYELEDLHLLYIKQKFIIIGPYWADQNDQD
jgi:hypothetical protein